MKGNVLPFPTPAANDPDGSPPSVASLEWVEIVRRTVDMPEHALLAGIEAGIGLANLALGAGDDRTFYRRILAIYAQAARILIHGGELPGVEA